MDTTQSPFEPKRLIEAVNLICLYVINRLPDDWEIVLRMSHREATLELLDPEGKDQSDDVECGDGCALVALCDYALNAEAAKAPQAAAELNEKQRHEHCDPTAFHFFGPRWAIRAASLSDALVTFRRLQGFDLETIAPNRISIVTPQGTVFAVPEGSLVRYSHVVPSTPEAEGLVEFLRIQGRYDVGKS